MTKAQKLKLIWRHTHKDFRGTLGSERAILVLRRGGTTSVTLTSLTDAEIEDKLRFAMPAEQRRLAAKKRVEQEDDVYEERLGFGLEPAEEAPQ